MNHVGIIHRLPQNGKIALPKTLFAFIWYFIRQMCFRFWLLVILGVLAGICSALTPYFFGKLVQVFTDTIDKDQIWQNLKEPLIWFTFISLICAPILYNVQGWLSSVTLPFFANLIRRQLMLYAQGHSYRFFQDDFAGRLAGKIVEMPVAIRLIVSDITGPFIYAAVTFIVSLIVFATIGWMLCLFAALYILGYAINTLYFIPKIQSLSENLSIKRSIVRGRAVDVLSNIFLVKLFARQNFEDKNFVKAITDSASATSVEEVTITRMFRVQHVLNSSFMLSLIYATVMGWQAGIISTAEISMILPVSMSMVSATFWLTEVYTQFFQRLGEVQEGMMALVTPHDVIDSEDAKPLIINKPIIEFKAVNFSYPSRPMFEDFNLTIRPHERIGLVGPSGAGKSSFVQLLLRLHDIQSGEILIDGQNIKNVTQNSLREQIGMIPQNADLLHRTVRENIAYGHLEATEDEIIQAAKHAEAHDFIMTLRDKDGRAGYDALVGERGVKLSGGQRQRLAIARALLKNAPILVLDEATASLDSESEKLIQKSLQTVMQDRTVIVIAHRLSTIAHLDRLIIMDNGNIIEDGSHEELLKKDGLYARLWALQSGGFLGGTKAAKEL